MNLSIVRNARVSYDAEWRTGEDEGKDAKLIAYLVKNRHTSPFEAVSFTFDVKAPIFVFRQWHRHRTWSFNEVSARYAELPEEFYVPAEGRSPRSRPATSRCAPTEQHPRADDWRNHDVPQPGVLRRVPRDAARRRAARARPGGAAGGPPTATCSPRWTCTT
jgi:flavin-dependent thymidylate synthase